MAASPGHIELERSLDSIIVGRRHRTDLGDIDALIESIRNEGLLQPITVTPDGALVCGLRRLEALRRLGHRSTNVWVRSGLTDHLNRLLAEQNDNALHKPLSLIEAESLYRELKALIAEDAARRQAATRFGAESGQMLYGVECGGGDSPPPGNMPGKSREQAARIVTGRDSYQMLERLGRLKDLAVDETQSEHIRAQAAAEIASIEAGGKVNGAHLRMNAALSLEELDRVAASTDHPDLVRAQAAASAAEVRAATPDARAASLAQLAEEAVARIKAQKRKPTRPRTLAPAASVMLPPRAFIALWADLDGWTAKYDPEEIAATLSVTEWDHVEHVLAETARFLENVRELRNHLPQPGQVLDTGAG